MKKKSFVKIFSLILCLCFALFSFVGCTESNKGGDESEPSLLSGVKVLTRPENYDFDAALGDFSTNYFNILSKWMLDYLYQTYGEAKYIDPDDESNIVGPDAAEITDYNGLENRAYMVDSTRYTITEATAIESNIQTVTIDTSAKWNWSIEFVYETDSDLKAYFYNSSVFGDGLSVESMTADGKIKFVFNYSVLPSSWTDWTSMFTAEESVEGFIPNYSSSYYKDDNKTKSGTIVDYYYSPYYSNEYSPDYPGDDGTFTNYFQDALEYAIYLISLGYTVEDDADYFDFSISYDSNGLVSDMTVGGWDTNKISVSDKDNGALKRAREKYEKQINFVGLTDTVVDEIKNFVKKIVIGDNALAKDTVYTGAKDTVNTGAVTIKRDYDKVVSNIVKYACEQAPIGKDKDGKPITLSKFFLTSKITDYEGDYFGINIDSGDEDAEGDDKYDDKDLFKNIDAAEYQSIVLFPPRESIGKKLGDIWMAFEYYDLEKGSTRVIDQENGITINVGIRYFNSQTKQIVELGEKSLTIKYGKNGETEDYPMTELIFGEGDTADVQFENSVVLNTGFNNNIGDGVINALENGTVDGDNNFKKSLPITTANKDYFKLNDSSSYGQYGTLDEDMFKKEDGCDFVEIYFNIVKDKNNPNKSYAFKFGATLLASESVF